MKWKEAYRCKKCNQIYKHKRDEYCKRCGAHITYERCGIFRSHVPSPRYATENLEAVIIKWKWFKYKVGKSNRPEWLIQGKPPPGLENVKLKEKNEKVKCSSNTQ